MSPAAPNVFLLFGAFVVFVFAMIYYAYHLFFATNAPGWNVTILQRWTLMGWEGAALFLIAFVVFMLALVFS